MPKLVQKCGYIRNGSAAKYMRYIATREGVEKLHGRGPVTQPQKELIERLLKDYPDTKELFEYSEYCASPTFGNASELITMALDANVHTMEAGGKLCADSFERNDPKYKSGGNLWCKPALFYEMFLWPVSIDAAAVYPEAAHFESAISSDTHEIEYQCDYRAVGILQ